MKKVFSLSCDSMTNIIIGKRGKTRDVWYCDGTRLYRPIFQTPRLPVHGVSKNGRTYSVSLENYDINPETGHLYNAIIAFDKKIQSLNPEMKVVSSLKWKDENPFMFYGLIDGTEHTQITTDKGEQLSINDIKNGLWADQYISPQYLDYSDNSIRTVWVAHQIVIKFDNIVYRDDSLLQKVNPDIQRASLTIPPAPLAPLAPPAPHSLVSLGDLDNAISKLKPSNPTSAGLTGRISIAELLQGKKMLKKVSKT